MNKEELMKILPHRDNMLLLDEVTRDGDWACGSFTIRDDAWFLKGHFPGAPVVPGVILCEILGQSTCILLADVMSEGKMPMYTGLNNVKFKAPVRPGDTFETRCRITRSKGPFFFGEGEGYVDGKLCVRADFSFAIVENKLGE